MNHSKFFIFLLLFLIFSISVVQYASGIELAHHIEKELVCASTTSTAIALTVINGTDFNMFSDRKYLLIAEGKIGSNVTSASISIDVRANNVIINGSSNEIETRATSDGCGQQDDTYNYLWFTVYQPTGDHDLTVNVEAHGVANTMFYDDIKLVIIEISESLTENTDWFFNENFVSSTLGTNFDTPNSATITFTPLIDDETWFILSTAELDTGTATVNFETRVNFTSATGNFTNIVLSQEGEDPATDNFVQTFARLIELNNTSTTIEVQSQTDEVASGTNERLSNRVFALNVDKLKTQNHIFNETDIVVSINNPAFGQEIDSINITPTVQEDFLIFGGLVKITSKPVHIRLQTDNVDTPINQTTDEYKLNEAWDDTDRLQTSVIDIVNLNTTTHSLDLDASRATANMTVSGRSLFAFSLATVEEFSSPIDPMSWIDSINATINFFESFDDPMSMIDDIRTDISDAKDDPMSWTDDIRIDLTKNFTDPMSMIDQAESMITISFDDPLSWLDDITIGLSRNFTDPMSWTDDIRIDLTKNFTDPMSMIDQAEPMITISFDDPMSMIDDIRTDISDAKDDPMSWTDDIRIDLTKNFTDPMSMIDQAESMITISFDDPLSWLDDITIGLSRNFTDSMSWTDFINSTVATFKDDPMSMIDDIRLDIVNIHDDPISWTDTINTFSTFGQIIIVTPPAPTGGIGGALPPTIPDSDGDGILDPEDACPLEPEDFDGFEDADGCPEDGFVQPPEKLVVPSIVDLIPFEFNELDVIDDFIDLEEDLSQPQVADLGVRWLGAEPITITSIDIGLSPFEIQVQDIPITFGNNRFGYTETQLLYTVQPPDKICGDVFTFDCLDKVTYKIPVVITGEINGKTVIANGSITIDNSDRINPYWLALFGLVLVPLVSVMFWKKRNTKITTKQKLKLTESKPNTTRTLTVTKSKPLKSGTTRKLLTESKKTNILGKKSR